MKQRLKWQLADDDIRYECRIMLRWCRLFDKTDLDWVNLAAVRFRERHPLLGSEKVSSRAA